MRARDCRGGAGVARAIFDAQARERIEVLVFHRLLADLAGAENPACKRQSAGVGVGKRKLCCGRFGDLRDTPPASFDAVVRVDAVRETLEQGLRIGRFIAQRFDGSTNRIRLRRR